MPICARCGARLQTIPAWVRLGPGEGDRLERRDLCRNCGRRIVRLIDRTRKTGGAE